MCSAFPLAAVFNRRGSRFFGGHYFGRDEFARRLDSKNVAMVELGFRRRRKRTRSSRTLRRAESGVLDRRDPGFYRAAFDAMPTPTAVVDPERGSLRYINPALERLIDRSAAELEGSGLEVLIGAEGMRPFVHALQAADDRDLSVTLRTEGHAVLTTARLNTLHQGGQNLRLVTFYREARESTRQSQVDAEARLETLAALAGSLAHELNNMLGVLVTNADCALYELPPDSTSHKAALAMRAAAMEGVAMTHQLLALAGRPPLARECSDVGAVLAELAPNLRKLAGPNNALELRVAPALPEIELGGGLLRQLIVQLVTNAIEAIGERAGTVKVNVESAEVAGKSLDRCHLRTDKGTCICLEVIDDGVGLSPEDIDRVFDPLFTTKAQGRGLGLATVLGMVKTHQGGMRIRSRPGVGTTFFVCFRAAPRVAATRPSVPPPQQSGTYVLLVDDEQTLMDAHRRVLNRHGYSVLTATDGRDAVSTFAVHSCDILAVVMDVTMPVMDGLTALGHMREVNTKVPILLTSGFGMTAEVDAACALPGVTFFQKPTSTRALLDALGKLRSNPAPCRS